MSKTCNHNSCSNPVFGGGYCNWHQGYRDDKKVKAKKKQKPISPISKSRAKDLAKYRVARNEYKKDNPNCEFGLCYEKGTDIHHKRGKDGSYLYNKKYFMHVCRDHHEYIENNREWSYQMGYLLLRTTR